MVNSHKFCNVTNGLKVLPPWLFRLGTARPTKLFLPWVALFSIISCNNGKINKLSSNDNRYRHPRKDTSSPKVYDLKKPLWTEFVKQCQKTKLVAWELGLNMSFLYSGSFKQTCELCSWDKATTTILFQILSEYFLLFDFGCFLSSFLSELFFVPLSMSWSEESTRNHLTDVLLPMTLTFVLLSAHLCFLSVLSSVVWAITTVSVSTLLLEEGWGPAGSIIRGLIPQDLLSR